MTKEDYKEKVLKWLAENNIFPKKVRVYNYPRYGLEVRIYQEPQMMQNHRKSFRETSRDENQRHGSYGIHETKISLYAHINENDFTNKEERKFILDTIRNS